MPGYINQVRQLVRSDLGLRDRGNDKPPRASDIILGMTLVILGVVLMTKGIQLLTDVFSTFSTAT
jgi:hypothetical protein